MGTNNPRLGILLMIATTFVFAVQDGISRYLAVEYNVLMIVMIRYWFFAAFVVALAARSSKGVMGTARTTQPVLQIFRGFLLSAEICIAVTAFVLLGLVETHAIFAVYPLIVAALAGPVLGEKVGWRRWLAIGVGFIGILIILKPGLQVFSPYALIALAMAGMFALYGLLTRYVARKDAAQTSFFWTGIAGAVLTTVIGFSSWQPLTQADWLWMGALSLSGVTGHFLLIKCLEITEASTVQPFAYFQLVFASIMGVAVFGESIKANVALGAGIIVSAGLFALWRERVSAQKSTRSG